MTEIPNRRGEIKTGKVKPIELDVIAHQYAEYLQLDAKQQIEHFDDGIEELLTRLDEYHGLLDMIRSDTSLCLQKNLPLIRAKNVEMERLFDRIDKLEMFVSIVKKNVSVMEDQVDKAESELGSFSAIRKAFGSIPLPSFFGSKKTSPVKTVPQYTSPEIFRTKDYISASIKKTKPDSELLKTSINISKSMELEQTHIPAVGHHVDDVDAANVQMDQSNSPDDIRNRVSESEATTTGTISQSDSGFQSPVHLNDNGDVRSKMQIIQS